MSRFALFAAALLVSTAAASELARFVPLGYAPGEYITRAAAISADGSTVVGTTNSDGFVWTEAEGLIVVPDTQMYDVSADGTYACGAGIRPFRWSRAGGVELLWGDSGGIVARCISPDGGRVAGTGPGPGLTIWTEGQGLAVVENVGEPVGVSNGGLVVGSSFGNAAIATAIFSGTFNGLAAGAIPTHCSSDCSLFVGARNGQPFLAGLPDKFMNVPIPGGAIPRGLSDDGRIIVGERMAGFGGQTAFIAIPGACWMDLKDFLMTVCGLPVGDWRFITCYISANGKYVAGSGVSDVDGELQAFWACLGDWEDRISAIDTNGDGTIDLDDLLIVLGSFGMVGPAHPGDLDHDGSVDLDDLLLLLASFGAPCAADPNLPLP